MLITIITVVLNSAETITDTINSVLSQSYQNVEHIIIDGGSTDGTLEIIDSNRKHFAHVLSEPDTGIFDAMNKGISLSSGNVIGFLNSDDIFYNNNILDMVADTLGGTEYEACYGDLVYVEPRDLQTIVRYYSSKKFRPDRLAYGLMPAHPTLYLRRELLERLGGFKASYAIAGDFELVARIFGNEHIQYKYLSEIMVRMRTGGVSTRSWKSNVRLNNEILRACRENGISSNLFKIYSKYPWKLMELFSKNRK